MKKPYVQKESTYDYGDFECNVVKGWSAAANTVRYTAVQKSTCGSVVEAKLAFYYKELRC